MTSVLDNRTLVVTQAIVSMMRFIVMSIVWNTQKTYPGFGRWTFAKRPNAYSWLLPGLQDFIPDWLSIIVGSCVLLISPLLANEGIRQFCGKQPIESKNHLLCIAIVLAIFYFTLVKPDISYRIALIYGGAFFFLTRSSCELFLNAPRLLRSSY